MVHVINENYLAIVYIHKSALSLPNNFQFLKRWASYIYMILMKYLLKKSYLHAKQLSTSTNVVKKKIFSEILDNTNCIGGSAGLQVRIPVK